MSYLFFLKYDIYSSGIKEALSPMKKLGIFQSSSIKRWYFILILIICLVLL